jgi:hypothetical protein
VYQFRSHSPVRTIFTKLLSKERRNTHGHISVHFTVPHNKIFVSATGLVTLIIKHIVKSNIHYGCHLVKLNGTFNHRMGLNFCPLIQSCNSWHHFSSSNPHYKVEVQWRTTTSLANRFPIRSHVHENSTSLGNGKEKRRFLTTQLQGQDAC